MIALICTASVLFGAWLWWRFPIFYHAGGEAGYWGGMIILAVCWPLMLPLLAGAYLVFYLIPQMGAIGGNKGQSTNLDRLEIRFKSGW
jgi:hypothetical protein